VCQIPTNSGLSYRQACLIVSQPSTRAGFQGDKLSDKIPRHHTLPPLCKSCFNRRHFQYNHPTMSDKVAGKKRAASSEPEIDHRFDGIADFDQEETEAGPSTSAPKSKSTSTKSKSTSKKRKTLIPGIVYISRLPPGMTPQKVKYLMAQWGDVGKIYAQKKDGVSPFLCRVVRWRN
jgi:hypothetical protein